MVGALHVLREHEIMLISSTGTLVRTPVAEISVVGRNTQGVRLIRLEEGERLVGIERVEVLNGEASGDIDTGNLAAETPDPA
jgi:DNA gyrase subunit A